MQSKYLFLLPPFLIVMSLLLGEAHSSGEQQSWGESCNPNAFANDDQSTLCDNSKRLSCHASTRTCTCHHEARDFYNREEDRCETKIGSFCSPSETFPTICAENAECDAVTNFCVCKQGSLKNEDSTACIKEHDEHNGASSTSHFNIYVSIAILTIGTQVLGF